MSHAVARWRVGLIQAINEKAEAENRDYSDVEDKRHKELKSEIAGLDRQIVRAADVQEATRSAPAILHHGRGDGAFEDRAREYSLLRAIASQIPGTDIDAGKEREISRELERRSGRRAQGLLAPMSVFEKRVDNSLCRPGRSAIAHMGRSNAPSHLNAWRAIDITTSVLGCDPDRARALGRSL
jgi:hypothetical protein